MRISILSNVNLDMLDGLLKKEHEVYRTSGYGEWAALALRREQGLADFAPECLLLLLEGNELLKQCTEEGDWRAELDRTKEYAAKLAENYPDSFLLVSTIDVRPECIRGKDSADGALAAAAYWDGALSQLSGRYPNLHRFELRSLIEEHGRKAFYSSRFWYLGSVPYDMRALHVLADEIRRVLGKLCCVRRKVLVLDLDNTLWGGVAGEDGPEGIVLGGDHEGAVYQDTQREIRRMQRQGVLLAIASKNNPEDVTKIFRENPHMVLREEDFAAICANWEPKHENVRKMAEELNLGLDAFVFVDDNEAERAAMRIHLPEVAVVEFPAETAELPERMRRVYEEYFWSFKLTEEDREKTRQYREEKQRRDERAAAASYEDYLRSLETKIRLARVTPERMERAVQLMNKTNQFNVCTLRMDVTQLNRYLAEENGQLIMAEVSDKYGNSGWVAEFLYHTQGSAAIIDNFLMSCRVMGRMVEDAVFAAVRERLFSQGITEIRAAYRKTAKNKPVERLWEQFGFAETGADGECRQYRLLRGEERREKTDGERVHTVVWEEAEF